MMKFSVTTGCFYPDGIQYDELPGDLIQVSDADYNAAMCRSPDAILAVKDGALVIVMPEQSDADRLTDAKLTQTEAIRSACAAAITAGFTSCALGDAHFYGSTQTDQANLVANVVSSIYPGLPADWNTLQLCADANGVWTYRAHTAAQIQQVGADGKTSILACLTRKIGLQARIDAAKTVGEVQAVRW